MGVKRVAVLGTELITLSEAKAQLRVVHSLDDDRITQIITAARDMVERVTRRQIIHARYEYTMSDFPDIGYYYLPRPPLIGVESVQYYDTGDELQTLTDYRVDSSMEIGLIMPEFSGCFPATSYARTNSVITTYTSGYESSSDLPGALRQLMLMQINDMYDNTDALVDSKMTRNPTIVSMANMFRVAIP